MGQHQYIAKHRVSCRDFCVNKIAAACDKWHRNWRSKMIPLDWLKTVKRNPTLI